MTAVDGIDLGIGQGEVFGWQDESAPAELTVREAVRHFTRYHPRPRNPEEVIAPVGLEAKADRRIKAFRADSADASTWRSG